MKVYERSVMPRTKSPCQHCEDRTVGCHSTCEKYKAFVDERLEIGENIKQHRKEENILNSFQVGCVQKSMKKRYGTKPPAR